MLAVLLPVRCAVCLRIGAAVCRSCIDSFLRVGPTGCARCGAPGPWPIRRCAECAGRRLAFSAARSALVYDGSARAFVAAWKERGRRDLADVAGSIVISVLPEPPAPIVTFVPSDPERRLERGHAPPERLARALGDAWGVPVEPLLRRRHRRTRQRGLTLAERRANVRGAYRPAGAAPRAVCLVDDVYTSGSTVNACASALRRAGARQVEVVTLARAVR